MNYSEDIIHAVENIEKQSFVDYWNLTAIIDTLKWDYNHLVAAYENESGELAFCENFSETIKGEVVGYVVYSVVANETELYRIAVATDKRKKGYGYKLMERYLTEVKGKAYRGFLEVREGNESAIILYEKCLYKKIATRKNYYNNPVENALIYELELP